MCSKTEMSTRILIGEMFHQIAEIIARKRNIKSIEIFSNPGMSDVICVIYCKKPSEERMNDLMGILRSTRG